MNKEDTAKDYTSESNIINNNETNTLIEKLKNSLKYYKNV